MNYMMLVYCDESLRPGATGAPEGCQGLSERLTESGHYRAGGILQPTSASTSVRLREGKRLVTDGPFAETREQLAGFMLIEAHDLDEAIGIAAEHPVSEYGTIEIRPLKMLA